MLYRVKLGCRWLAYKLGGWLAGWLRLGDFLSLLFPRIYKSHRISMFACEEHVVDVFFLFFAFFEKYEKSILS